MSGDFYSLILNEVDRAADRRHPLRAFNPALIEAFLAGRQLVSADLLPGGKSNTNYKLLLSDGAKCVLRLCAGATTRCEHTIMNLVRECVPVPATLALGEDWTVHSFLEGTPLAAVAPAVMPQGTFAAAQTLAHIARVKFPIEGWIQTDGTVTPFDFGGHSFVASMLARPDVQG